MLPQQVSPPPPAAARARAARGRRRARRRASNPCARPRSPCCCRKSACCGPRHRWSAGQRRDREGIGAERAEIRHESGGLLARQVLLAEEHHALIQHRAADLRRGPGIERLAQVHAMRDRADRRGDRLDVRSVHSRHQCLPLIPAHAAVGDFVAFAPQEADLAVGDAPFAAGPRIAVDIADDDVDR